MVNRIRDPVITEPLSVPNAEIITAGLPDSRIKGSVPLLKFIKQMYRAGAAGAFDTLAVNGYAPTGKGVVKLITHIRKVVNSYGGSKTALVHGFHYAFAGAATFVAAALVLMVAMLRKRDVARIEAEAAQVAPVAA